MFKKLFCLLAVLAIASIANAGLVANWKFDDGTTKNVSGYAGTAADGTLVNGAQIVALGPEGYGDGTEVPGDRGYNGILQCWGGMQQYMDVGGSGTDGWAYTPWPPVGGGTTNGVGWTVSAWFRVRHNPAWAPDQLMSIVSKGAENNQTLFSLQRSYSTEVISICTESIFTWGDNLKGTSPCMEDHDWHHVVAAYAPLGAWSGTIDLYVDTVLEASWAGWWSGNVNNPLWDIWIGATPSNLDTDGNPYFRMNGYIDNVYIYDEGLNSQQVSDLYYAQDDLLGRYVPEPATIALLGLGGLALLRRKR